MEPKQIVDAMYKKDWFSQWLGIERIEDGPGMSILKMTITKDMLNGFGIAHGGITYSFADSAFAFASNSQGRHAVSVETSISHLVSLVEGDIIMAYAKEISISHKLAIYSVEVKKDSGELISLFKGTVYRKSKEWEPQ